MTIAPNTTRGHPGLADALAVYLKGRVLIVLFLGFSAGLPLALSGSTLLVWMREAGVNLGTIGLFALVGTPYTIKFLWAPVVNALDVPVLSRFFGHRRGWLLFSQFLLIVAIVFLAFCNPTTSPWLVALGALLVSTCSATQDIVIDAFRIESLPESEQAAGMASYVGAYRIGMLVSTAGALFLVSGFEALGYTKGAAWTAGYLAMAALVVIGVVTVLVASEPEKSAITKSERAIEPSILSGARIAVILKYAFFFRPALILLLNTRIGSSAYRAFADFLIRDMAFVVLAFVVLYKLCDAFAGALTAPFVIDLGFSRNDYAAIVKGVGVVATLVGGFAGGALARAYPLVTALWIGAFLQMASKLHFHLASSGWRESLGIDVDHHRGEFHRRDRYRGLRRLSLGSLPEPAPYGHAICAAHRPCRCRTHLSFGGRRLRRRKNWLANLFRYQRADSAAGHWATRLVAATGPFRLSGKTNSVRCG